MGASREAILRLAEESNVVILISQNGNWMKREGIDSKWLSPAQLYRKLYWKTYTRKK